MKRLSRKDVWGERLEVGDIVRIVGVPDLSGMSADCRAESLPMFEHLVGTYKRIEEFDEYGLAWLRFKIRKALVQVTIQLEFEPRLLKLRRVDTRRPIEVP